MNGRRRLAELFGQWMDRNGYTQGEVAALGGPSTTTQTKVRHTDDPISRQTLRQLDAVMGWPGGTSAGILQGYIPDPATEIVVPAVNTDNQVLYVRPDGVSDEDWDQIVTSAQGYIEWQIQQALRGASS